jgi:hypothetical protein
MPISTPVVAATAAVVVNSSIAGLKLKKQQQQQQQQQQKIMYSTAPNNNINKVRCYTGADRNCSQPFQANSNTIASTIMHGNYNTASYNYNNNNNNNNYNYNNNQHQKQQLANSYVNTIVNASSAALDVPVVADASLPVVERMPSDIETFTGGMNYSNSSAVSNSNNNSSSTTTSTTTTVPSILPQKQGRGKLRTSLQSSLPLGPSHLSTTSTATIVSSSTMNSNYIYNNNNNNNNMKYSSSTSDDRLESTAGVLHCEALLSLFNGYH